MICDSVGESSLTALKAASQLWPEIFDTDSARQQAERIISGMREVRPVVETGDRIAVNVVDANLISTLLDPPNGSHAKQQWMHQGCRQFSTGLLSLLSPRKLQRS